MKIIPAILEKDFDSVKSLIDTYSKISVSIQIDVCDGIFVENKTWKPNPFEDINGYLLDLEFDMMVEDVLKYLDFLSMYDAKKIVVHTNNIEVEDFKLIYQKIKDKNSLFEIGICDNDINKIKSLKGFYDYVQLMGIKNVGQQGQSFDDEVLNSIKELREFVGADALIQIDGAMTKETIKLAKEAGANCFVVGSYLKNSIKDKNLKETFLELKSL
ncbi:MAG: ribulose-phosphate 3-epimerase [Patescibacteria group bacterium]|nr:ribulose-phosphate 3-epimerase [Patescibacteria group bacterium]